MDVAKSVHRKLRGSSVVVLYYLQEGVAYRTLHGMTYPLFGQYLNVAGHTYGSLRSIFSIAWSLKIFFSFFSDSMPIFGYRRIPYVTFGLTAILLSLATIGIKPRPIPYYSIEDFSANGTCERIMDPPLNPEAPNAAFLYIVLFFIWYAGLSCADSTIDGLLTQRSKLEPFETRGTLISYTRISGELGGITAALLTGLLLNKTQYGGNFCEFGLEFNQTVWILFFMLVLGLVYAFIYTNEKDVDQDEEPVAVGHKLKQLWGLFHQWNYLKLLIFALIISVQWSLRSPAIIKVQMHWAKVQPLVSAFVSVLTSCIGGIGMVMYMRFFLRSNWRLILVLVIAIQITTELPVVGITVFNVFRNQYFWFVDDIFDSVIRFWFVYVLELVIVEYAPDGIEGISYAFIWAIVNIGRAFGSALGNFLMSPFCLTDDSRYIRDSDEDRWAVMSSYLVTCGFQIATLFSVFLIPKQKEQAQEWRQKCEEKKGSMKSWNASIFIGFSVVGFICAVTLNFMTLFESTRCLMIVGGPGCDVDPSMPSNSRCILMPPTSASDAAMDPSITP